MAEKGGHWVKSASGGMTFMPGYGNRSKSGSAGGGVGASAAARKEADTFIRGSELLGQRLLVDRATLETHIQKVMDIGGEFQYPGFKADWRKYPVGSSEADIRAGLAAALKKYKGRAGVRALVKKYGSASAARIVKRESGRTIRETPKNMRW